MRTQQHGGILVFIHRVTNFIFSPLLYQIGLPCTNTQIFRIDVRTYRTSLGSICAVSNSRSEQNVAGKEKMGETMKRRIVYRQSITHFTYIYSGWLWVRCCHQYVPWKGRSMAFHWSSSPEFRRKARILSGVFLIRRHEPDVWKCKVPNTPILACLALATFKLKVR